jgi:hypothetical protein
MEAIAQQSHVFGRGLRMITAALSPELILIAGDITAAWDQCGPIIQQELDRSMLAGTVPRLAIAGDAELARLSGSAAMPMQLHASYHRSTDASTDRSLPLSKTARLNVNKCSSEYSSRAWPKLLRRMNALTSPSGTNIFVSKTKSSTPRALNRM